MARWFKNFFKHDVEAIGDVLSGVVGTASDTFKGLTGGGWDYSDVVRDIKNYGYDWEAVAGVDKRIANPIDAQNAAAKAAASAAAATNAFYQPTTAGNSALWRGSSQSVYSGQSPLSGVAPPSHLSAISNPASKVLISSTRGQQRNTLNTINTATDALSAHQIAGATMPAASAVTNSAGGTGVTTSMDMTQGSSQ